MHVQKTKRNKKKYTKKKNKKYKRKNCNEPFETVVGGAGVIVSPAFCVNARKSRTVADVNAASRPILKSTTSSTSIFSIVNN